MKTELEPKILRFADGTEVKNAEDFKKRRAEMLDILAREEYGYMPPVMGETRLKFIGEPEYICAGMALLRRAEVSFDTPKGEFSFPVKLMTPDDGEKHPCFLFNNFQDLTYHHYLPIEEIIAHQYSVALIYYNDITSDNNDMSDKLAGMYDRADDGTGYGKITLWAFAMSRLLDRLGDCPGFDAENVASIGHSRLGKTSLWCGANDERIKLVISNDSGCGGASSERIKHEGAEKISDMAVNFPFWFCENRSKYIDKPDEMPFDQHFLLACAAPRYLSVGSAEKDTWADPYSEQLSCFNASPAWEIQGFCGYTGKEEPAEIGESFDGGRISYHIRRGTHFLSRTDWLYYMKVFDNVIGR